MKSKTLSLGCLLVFMTFPFGGSYVQASAPEDALVEPSLGLATGETVVTETGNQNLDFSMELLRRRIVEEPPPPQPVAVDPIASLKGVQGSVSVQNFTGAATFRFPLKLPAGRGDMTPSLNISYNSNSRNYETWIGLGWDLNVSSIYRNTERGIDNLYFRNDFTAQMAGTSEDLIETEAGGVFGAKIEEAFRRYVFENNTWIVQDPSGLTYTFGSRADTRLSDPSDSTRIYRWMLEKVEDLHGNFMTYTYFTEEGQIYPDTIRYTQHGQVSGIYEVRFVWRSRPSYIAYSRGFKTINKYLLDKIDIYKNEGGEKEVIYTYDFDYDVINNAIQELRSITHYGQTQAFPPTLFTYYDGTEGAEYYVKKHLIKSIAQPTGGSYHLEYKPSTAYRLSSGQVANSLPFVVYTVSKLIQKEPVTASENTTTYDYQGGHMYYDLENAYKKEYAGFHRVRVTDPLGQVTKTYFHQSEKDPKNVENTLQGEHQDHIAKKGRIYRQEQYDHEERLYKTTINKWEKKPLVDLDPDRDRFFVFLAQDVHSQYDGGSVPRSKAIEYQYDSWGNTTQEMDLGEVTLLGEDGTIQDIGTDTLITDIEYAHNSMNYLHVFPFRETLSDSLQKLIGKTEYHYDHLLLGEVEAGFLTRQDQYVDSTQAVSQFYEYNALGQVIRIIDERGNNTDIIYDTYSLHPTQSINALNHITQFDYDLRFGVVREEIDPNGRKKVYQYDDLGRVITEQVSDPDMPTTLATVTTYSYDYSQYPIATTKMHNLQSEIAITEKTYLDGLERTIQVRTEAEGDNQFVVRHTSYDPLGRVQKTFLPFFGTGLAFEPVSLSVAGESFAYDCLGRLTFIVNPLGTTSLIYVPFQKTVIDPTNHRHEYDFNVRGQLVEVREFLANTALSMQYNYDLLGNLLQMTDTKGNQKNFTYDFLGRKLTESDWHVVGDVTVGNMFFQYDAHNNIIQKTDPKNQVVNYTYDKLNRLVIENFIGTNGLEIQYTYDQGSYGIGRLSSIVTPSVTKGFAYDLFGRVQETSWQIDGQNFSLGFDYDWQGNLLSVQYPAGEVAQYTYGSEGKLQSVALEGANIITNMDYSPSGSVSFIDYANDTQTVNTYLSSQMYRLIAKETTFNTSFLQKLNYVYDAVGNIIQITDLSDTQTAKVTNYTYDDLSRLVLVSVSQSANSDDYTRSYVYDEIGNVTYRSDVGAYVYAGGDGATASETYATPHAVTQAGSIVYTYDQNGNLVSNGTWDHVWDYENRLISSTQGSNVIRYTYDESGNRLTKENTTTQKKTYYIDQYFDLEDGQGKIHVYAGDQKVATKLSQ